MKQKQKFHWLPLLLAICVILSVVLIGLNKADNFSKQESFARRAWVVEANDRSVKAQVESAVSMLAALNSRVEKGEMSLAKAKTLGADLLREMRYGQDGYFWVDTTDGVNVVLYGKKEVEGKNRIDSVVNGVYHVQEIIKNGMKPGGGFTDYYYTKKDGDQPLAKRGYSLLFVPFDWVVGTGYYLTDIK